MSQFRQSLSLNNLILLVFFLSVNFCFGQKKLVNQIKVYNKEANYEKSLIKIQKYQNKKYDTLDCNYLISLADYYCIPESKDYNPFKAIALLKYANCENVASSSLMIYFKDTQNCKLVINKRKEQFVSLYFDIIYNSNDLDILKSFYTDFKNYNIYQDKVYQKIALISFKNAKKSNSKSELLKFEKEFSNTSFAFEAKILIESIEYNSATLINTIDSYTAFLKNFPQTNRRDLILPKLEILNWEKCNSLNTKESFQAFIDKFPNSRKLQEAKILLSKFYDTYNLGRISSFYTLSNDKQMFNPFRIINGMLEYPNFNLLEFSNNGKIALIESSNKMMAGLLNLVDGEIFYEFPYVSLSNYYFSSDDSKLFYIDDNFIKQIDLKSFEITNLFKLENLGNQMNIVFDKNVFHTKQSESIIDREAHTIYHYTYDLISKEKKLNTFIYDNTNVRNLKDEFNTFPGNTADKILMLMLFNKDNFFQVKKLTKTSKNEYLILDLRAFSNGENKLYVIKNGKFVYEDTIFIKKTNKVSKEEENIILYDQRTWNLNCKIQLTDDNKIIIPSRKSLFILELGSEDGLFTNNRIITTHLDPFEIKISGGDRFMFAKLNEKTGKLYYQLKAPLCNESSNYLMVNYSNKRLSSKNGMQAEIKTKLTDIDKELSSFYNDNINSETIKNQPFETDKDKYVRVWNSHLKMNPTFIRIQDSLFYDLNETIKDSIKVVKYEPTKVFKYSNYKIESEIWKLAITNPFNGKNISLFYSQSKSDAKLNFLNSFSDLLIDVKYYYNLISLTYEPILVSITNTKSQICDRFIIPYKDYSLLKNLFFTDNSFFETHQESKRGGKSIYEGDDYLFCKLKSGLIKYDENIQRYFVNNGKPKFYFNYGLDSKNNISILNLDNINFNYKFQNEFIECCPTYIDNKDMHDINGGKYLSFDDVNYFINESIVTRKVKLETSVYEINNTDLIGTRIDIDYPGKVNTITNLSVKYKFNYYHKDTVLKVINQKTRTTVKTFNIIELGGYLGSIKDVEVDWDAAFSPNGKYFALRSFTKTYLYETSNWTNVMSFNNTSGKIYWDCNSYYLGVGSNLLPVPLLDKLY